MRRPWQMGIGCKSLEKFKERALHLMRRLLYVIEDPFPNELVPLGRHLDPETGLYLLQGVTVLGHIAQGLIPLLLIVRLAGDKEGAIPGHNHVAGGTEVVLLMGELQGLEQFRDELSLLILAQAREHFLSRRGKDQVARLGDRLGGRRAHYLPTFSHLGASSVAESHACKPSTSKNTLRGRLRGAKGIVLEPWREDTVRRGTMRGAR